MDDLSSLGELITKEISMVNSYSLVDYDINGGEGLESVSVTLSCSNINDFSRLNGISFYLGILHFTKDNYDVSRCILKVKEASTGKTMLYLIGDDDAQFYGFIIASGLEPPHGPVIYETDYDVSLY